MKDTSDLLVVFLLAAIVWFITAGVTMALSASGPISVAIATALVAGFVVFWIKGRSVSREESRKEADLIVSDFEIVRSYGALFEGLDTGRYIYDQSLLPYRKERILSAAIHVLEREDSPEFLRAGAALATELSQFQYGVGSAPQPTLMSIMLEPIPRDGVDGVEQHADAVARYKKSDNEIKADREREKIHSLIANSLGKAS